MKLEELCHKKTNVHHGYSYPQYCQSIAFVETDKHNTYVLIYDADNGHWLTIPDRKEVGYLFDLRVSEESGNERIIYIVEFGK